MIIHLIFIAIVTVLWCIGDHKNAWARDLVIPFLVGGILFLAEPFSLLWINLAVAVATAGACNIIRFGYGAYDPINDDKPSLLGKLTKDTDGWIIRTIWGAVVGIVSCLPYSIASVMTGNAINLVRVVIFTVLFSFVAFIVCRLRFGVLQTGICIGVTYSLISFVFRIS